MMGAVVVALVAALCMLLAGTVITGLRLVASVRQLIAALEGVGRQLRPLVSELQDNAEVAGIEVAELQSSITALGGSRRPGKR